MGQDQRTWKIISEDIATRTGLTRSSQYDTRKKRVAELVLPLLADCVLSVEDSNVRLALYLHFLTQHADAYFDRIVEWWRQEQYSVAVSTLSQAIALLMKPANARRIWDLCRSRDPFDYTLAAELTRFPEVSQEVRDSLAEKMAHGVLTAAQLGPLTKINDSRIRAGFERLLKSPDRYVRRLAEGVMKEREPLPSDVEILANPPLQSSSIFSAEIDLEELSSMLSELSARFSFDIPKALKKIGFLSCVETNRWMQVATKSHQGDPLHIALRMEDVDTVHLVLTFGFQ